MKPFVKNQIIVLTLTRQGKTQAEIHKLKGIKVSTVDYALKSAIRKIDQAIELLRCAAEIDCLNEKQVKDLKSLLEKV